jgi:molybdate transport system substrate-binding protein
MRRTLLALALASSLLAGRAVAADRVAVAAAANMAYALDALDQAFMRANPDVTVTSETGASGTLVAQILHGAPYDVFLSADLDFPRKLAAGGGADASTQVTYAIGRLVLWTTRPGVDLTSVAAVVRDPAVQKLSIANAKTAPYGRAAEETLAKLGLMEIAKPKLVYGENITQTFQYVASGNVDAGFVALSLVLSPKLNDKGRYLEVPSALYSPIEQGAVITKLGATNPAARRYLDFLHSADARAILTRFGYRLP